MTPEFKVGDKLEALDWHKEEYGIDYVTITSINEENKVYHWEVELKWEFGGTLSSGYYFHEAKPYTKTAREYNSPIIQELLDEITPEEMQATKVRMLQELIHKQEDLDPELNEIISENFWDLVDSKSPYCPVCDACGEEGCCSATACEQHPDGSYCATYLKDLKFGYRMNKFFENEIADYLSPYAKEKYNDEWNRMYDEIYGNNKQ